MALVVCYNGGSHVPQLPVYLHPMRFVAAGAENRAAHSENSGECSLVQPHPQVFGEPSKTIAEADNLHVFPVQHGLAHPTNGRVQTGAVTAGRNDADAFNFSHGTSDKDSSSVTAS